MTDAHLSGYAWLQARRALLRSLAADSRETQNHRLLIQHNGGNINKLVKKGESKYTERKRRYQLWMCVCVCVCCRRLATQESELRATKKAAGVFNYLHFVSRRCVASSGVSNVLSARKWNYRRFYSKHMCALVVLVETYIM